MKPRDYRTDTGTDRRPGDRQPEPDAANGHEDPLADHHNEEVLAELSAVRAANAQGLEAAAS
jgi:hypothetical protein